MGKVIDYMRMHMGEMVVVGVMSAIMVGIGVSAGMHPLDALGRSGHH